MRKIDFSNKSITNTMIMTVIVFVVIIFSFIFGEYLPPAYDWHHTYFPAARALLNGGTPYYPGSPLENPIWVCLFLAPFAVFPEPVGQALLLFASVAAYYAGLHGAGLPRKWIPLIFLSPQVLYGISMGTIDSFVFMAPALHPILGFVVALSKPQIGIGFAVFLLVEWVREGKYREMLLALALAGGGILISLWLGMPFSGRLISSPWNTSLYPYSILPGLILLFLAVSKRWKWKSMIASPMLSPYLTFHSWVVLFTVNNPYYLTGMFVFSWAAYLTWHFLNL
jgi:hypothetical protein